MVAAMSVLRTNETATVLQELRVGMVYLTRVLVDCRCVSIAPTKLGDVREGATALVRRGRVDMNVGASKHRNSAPMDGET